MVGFPPGFTTDNHSPFRGIVKPSFKTTGMYSTVVALSKISGYVLGAQCNSKAGAGGCCKHVAALPYNILSYVAVVLAIIPVDQICIDTSQHWNRLSHSRSLTKNCLSNIGWVRECLAQNCVPFVQ